MDAFYMPDTVVSDPTAGPLQEYRDSHFPRAALGVLHCFPPCLADKEAVLEKALKAYIF